MSVNTRLPLKIITPTTFTSDITSEKPMMLVFKLLDLWMNI